MIADLADLPPDLLPGLVPHELWPDNVTYLLGWRKLQSIRPQGMSSIAGIPPTEIECWAKHCWQGDQQVFVKRMIDIDAAWCDAINDREARKHEEQEAANNGRRQ